jgi:hypothetical protein
VEAAGRTTEKPLSTTAKKENKNSFCNAKKGKKEKKLDVVLLCVRIAEPPRV